MSKKPIGSITWHDLTIPDAATVKDFYKAVVGWESTPLSMGDYDDYVMNGEEGAEGAAGMCHARGKNAGLPPVWMMYITVADAEASVQACAEGGGKIINPIRGAGGESKYAVLQDPAGAVFAVYQE